MNVVYKTICFGIVGVLLFNLGKEDYFCFYMNFQLSIIGAV